MTKTVQALLEDFRLLGEMQFTVVETVRALVKRTVSPLNEEVKYGGILFKSDVQFGGVFVYKERVTFEFSRGAEMPDADGFLEGGGQGAQAHKAAVCKRHRFKETGLLLAPRAPGAEE
jgi:hypothetical protein